MMRSVSAVFRSTLCGFGVCRIILYGRPWLARHGIGVTRNDLFRFGNVEQGKSPGLLVVPAKGVVGVSRMCSVRVRLLF